MENKLPFHVQLRYERELRGWSQADIAQKVGSDVKTVGRWENGTSLPRPYYRQKLYEVFGKNAQDMGLIEQNPSSEVSKNASALGEKHTIASADDTTNRVSSESVPRVDWGEAPHTILLGRERERSQLEAWIQQCRVVTVLGMGGVGKTTLAAAVTEQTQDNFDAIFWHSLHNAPPLEQFLKSALQFLSRQQHTLLSGTIEDLQTQLIQHLQQHHCLLILDNFESLLQAGQYAGHYQTGYEDYGRLLQRLGETQHRSCVLLTSREKPREVAQLEGKQSLVRTLSLTGVDAQEGRAILHEKGLVGNEQEWNNLIQLYSGNPLALQLVAESIQEVFGGCIAPFLSAKESVFGDITDLLDQHFQRLSRQEQDILYWLAIEREALSLEVLREELQQSGATLLETLASLRRRSLIETRAANSFTLQPVIMEYLTTRLVQEAVKEFSTDISTIWKNYAFLKAQAKEYVRAYQIRLILAPIAQGILTTLTTEAFEQQLRTKLHAQRGRHIVQRDYTAGNILNLLVHVQYDLRVFDFSHLLIQQAYLQHANLADTNFAYTSFASSVFTNTFGSVLSVTFSPDDSLLAIGIATGELWMYDVASGTPLFSCSGHTDGVWSVAFSPDTRTLASSSDDQTIRLWNIHTGECVKVLEGHTNRVRSLAFHPSGDILASGGDDKQVILWEVSTGRRLSTLQGHTDRIWSVAFSHNGDMLATGSTDRTICLWDAASRTIITTLLGHTNSIRSLAFSPNDRLLGSGSDDVTVVLWDIQQRIAIRTWRGHTNRVWSVAFDGNGQHIASGSEDSIICIWDVATGERVHTLQGHTHGVRSVAYSPHVPLLASGGDDQTLRLWETASGKCLKILQGYTNRIRSVSFVGNEQTLVSIGEDQGIRLWDVAKAICKRTIRKAGHGVHAIASSSDGTLLASGGEDQTICLWNTATGQHIRTLRGHTDWVGAVAFSRDGGMLASGSEDRTVRLWETKTGRCTHIFTGHTSWVRAVAFSPDSSILASCGDDQTIRIWQPGKDESLLILEGHTGRIRSLAFHPHKQRLISGSEDETIRIWNSSTGKCLSILQGHSGRVRSVAYNSDGTLLASSSDDQTIRLWNALSGECLAVLQGHTHRVRSIAFDPEGEFLVSSSDDGTLKLWQVQTLRCTKTLLNERPYERMNITGVMGLSETQKETLRLLGAVEDD